MRPARSGKISGSIPLWSTSTSLSAVAPSTQFTLSEVEGLSVVAPSIYGSWVGVGSAVGVGSGFSIASGVAIFSGFGRSITLGSSSCSKAPSDSAAGGWIGVAA